MSNEPPNKKRTFTCITCEAKNFGLWQFKKEASFTLRVTLSAILISLQGLFFKNVCFRQFKKEASYALRMTVSAILISLQGLFFKNIASGSLKRKQVTQYTL